MSRDVTASGGVHQLQQDLAHAGFHGPNTAAIYLGCKVLLFVLGISCGVALFCLAHVPFLLSVFSGGMLALLLFLLPNLVVSVLRGNRRGEIQRRLPDAVDLLEVCVSSGMGLDMAWQSVSEEIRRVSKARGLEAQIENLQDFGVTTCAPRLIAQMERAVAGQGFRVRRLPSGAGHDGMALGAITEICMLFVRCKGGISHSPLESITEADAAAGVRVLYDFIERFQLSA